jgi:hypothetical protein
MNMNHDEIKVEFRNMVNTHGGAIGFIFGGQNTECYQTIIDYVVASIINIRYEDNKIQLDDDVCIHV